MPTTYLALEGALLVATGDDGDWQSTELLAEPGDDDRLECLAADPRATQRLFCGTFEAGLFRSTDGGHEWERVGEETIDSASVMSVAVSPHDPAVVFAGTEPSAVYRSDDAGDTWTELTGVTDLPSADEWSFPPRPHTHHVRWLAPDPHARGRLYVGIEAGALVITDDGGDTWRERPPGSRYDNHTLATHPDDPGRVYSAAGDGYAESTDSGSTWETQMEGLDHGYVWGLAVDSGEPETVVVSAARGAHAAHSPGSADAHVYRTTDGGVWALAEDGLPADEGMSRPVLAANPERDGDFFAGCEKGLFRSTDGGLSWERLPIEWSERYEGWTARALVVLP